MTDTELPHRILARNISDMLMATRPARGRPHGGDTVSGIIFDIILSSNLAQLPYGAPESRLMARPGEFEAKRALLRPVSPHAVAQSMRLPYETLRSRVRQMIDAGHCERVDGGVIASAGARLDPPFMAMAEETVAAATEVLADLAGLGLDFGALAKAVGQPVPPAEGPPLPALVARIIIDVHIRYLEGLPEVFDSVIQSTVWTGVLRANVRRLGRSQDLAWRYSAQTAPPPDEFRDPISIRAVAAELGLPFETTRRHAVALAEKGLMTTAPGGGLIVPAKAVSEDGVGRGNRQLASAYGRLIADLARAGFDFDALARRAVDQRPGPAKP